MSKQIIRCIVEDELQQSILIKILQEFDAKFEIGEIYGLKGNSFIKSKLFAYNEAARISPYLVLTDLDNNTCPSVLISEWIRFKKSPNLIFRIAVREAESWLFSDRKNFAFYFKISESLIDRNTENINNPKEYLINLVRKSKNRNIREDIVPSRTALVGPNYNSRLADFVFNHWDYHSARYNNKSLDKLLNRLDNFSFHR